MDAPMLHREFLDEVLPRIQQDPRVAGIAVAGSLAEGRADVFSDVDLVVAIDDSAFEEVMADRLALIGTWSPLIVGFTGEHVGEPRLIITLAGPPLLHVDYKFVRVRDFVERTDDPDIVWDRDGTLKMPSRAPGAAETLDLQWIEDRIWVWVHYGAAKLGRGELFEVIGFLGYLREAVLGPLAARRVGATPRGVRHLESIAPHESRCLAQTLCGHDRQEGGRALLAAVELYRRWFDDSQAPVKRRHDAEALAVRYLQDTIDQVAA